MFRGLAAVSSVPTTSNNSNNRSIGIDADPHHCINKNTTGVGLVYEDTSIRCVTAFHTVETRPDQPPNKRHQRGCNSVSLASSSNIPVTMANTVPTGTIQEERTEQSVLPLPPPPPLPIPRLESHIRSESLAPSCAYTEASSISVDTSVSTFGSSSGDLKRTASHTSQTSSTANSSNHPYTNAFYPELSHNANNLIPPPTMVGVGDTSSSMPLYRPGSVVLLATTMDAIFSGNSPDDDDDEKSDTAEEENGEGLALDMAEVEDALNNQTEYFAEEEDPDEDNNTSNSHKGNTNDGSVGFASPPTSLNSTPQNPCVAKSTSTVSLGGEGGEPMNSLTLPPPVLSAVATSAESSSSTTTVVSFSGSLLLLRQQQQQQQHAPVLYSAIGSLEELSSSSYKGLKNRLDASSRKFEFPSTLIPPQATAAKKKKKNNLETALKAQSGRDRKVPINSAQVQQPKEPPKTLRTSEQTGKLASSLRKGKLSNTGSAVSDGTAVSDSKKVTISKEDARRERASSRKAPRELFRPSSDAYTPRMGKKEIKYKPAELRTPVQQMSTPLGTLQRPNFRDALRRVAMIIRQHIVKIERRFEVVGETRARGSTDGLFSKAMKEEFSEERFLTPRYKCTMVRVPMARSGMVCGLKKIHEHFEIPSEAEIYEFAHRLFKSVQLSSECSIVCLIYMERLMEASKVPLLASTWRPIFMCGLLLASKVWQDLSSWNIEFASVYPQYSLEAINRLELQFLRMVKWDLYISSSQYAKYYFALRSLVEKPDFRQRYNRMVGGVDTVEASQARQIEARSTLVKEEVLTQLSRSM
jgi:Cyclin